MNIALSHTKIEKQVIYLLGMSLIGFTIGALLFFGITLNQIFAVVFSCIVLTLWMYNRVYGLTATVILFMVKPFWLRVAYQVDTSLSGTPGFDLLSITPALILVGLIISHMYLTIINKEKLCPDRTRKWLMVFSILCFVSIFYPSNSIMVGLGGFERNILPNMLILFLAASIYKTEKDLRFLLKALLVVGLISVIYGLGQYILGIYPWEIKWFHEVGFSQSTAGWLTIGLRGIEFRIFSLFYYRTDFFFTNVLIFTMLFAYGKTLTGLLKKLKIFYYILWFILMIVTFERTPFIMSCMSMGVIYFMNVTPIKRKKLLTAITILGVGAYITLWMFEPYLKSSGIESLIRLAEMTNPFEAGSIHDRADNYWGPSLAIIKSNPLGVGIGNGSGTKASGQLDITSTGNIYTHNEVIQKVLETGIPGGIIFIVLMISVLRDSINLSRIKTDKKKYGIAMTACTVVFLMSSMITLTFSGGRGLTYWLLAGITLSLLQNQKMTKSNNTPEAQLNPNAAVSCE